MQLLIITVERISDSSLVRQLPFLYRSQHEGRSASSVFCIHPSRPIHLSRLPPNSAPSSIAQQKITTQRACNRPRHARLMLGSGGGIGTLAGRLAAMLLRRGTACPTSTLLDTHSAPRPHSGVRRSPAGLPGPGPCHRAVRRRWHSLQPPASPAAAHAAAQGAQHPGRTVLVGIDPDSQGAIAVLRWDGPPQHPPAAPGQLRQVELYDMPTLKYRVLRAGGPDGKRTRLDVRRIQGLLSRLAAAEPGAALVAYLEVAGLLPGNGNSAAYMNGYSIGLLYGTLCMAGFQAGLALAPALAPAQAQLMPRCAALRCWRCVCAWGAGALAGLAGCRAAPVQGLLQQSPCCSPAGRPGQPSHRGRTGRRRWARCR
jgi:hypothetical protein